jgi:hypothetical protein
MVKGTLVALNGCQIEEFLKFLPTMEYLEKEVKATSLKKEDVQTCWDDVLLFLWNKGSQWVPSELSNTKVD